MSDVANNRVKLGWQSVLTWIITALIAWGAVEARVRVLEDRYARVVEDIREIKSDVKTILREYRP